MRMFAVNCIVLVPFSIILGIKSIGDYYGLVWYLLLSLLKES